MRTKPGEVGLTILFGKYKKRAKKLNKSFDLTREEFANLTKQNCNYCDNPPSKISKHMNKSVSEDTLKRSEYVYNGIDRYDNNLGYTKENSVPCCSICNGAKADLTPTEWWSWVAKITAANS